MVWRRKCQGMLCPSRTSQVSFMGPGHSASALQPLWPPNLLSLPVPQEALPRLDATGTDLALHSSISLASPWLSAPPLWLIHSSLVQRVGMILNQAVIKPEGWRIKWFLLVLPVWRQE